MNTSSQNWNFAEDCSKILLEDKVITTTLPNASILNITTNISSNIPTQFDRALKYKFDSAGIWRFDQTLNNFVLNYTNASLSNLALNI